MFWYAGLDVLAGLAESALTEQQRAEEEERAPPVNMKPKPHRQKSAAATGHLVANDHQAFDTDSFSQRQHPGIQPYSRQAFGAGPSQLMPPGPSHATALGHPQSAAFRQLSHAPLASEHMQSADLPLSSQLPPHRQMHLGQSQSQPFSTRLPFGQAPKPTQDAPASVLWRSTGPDNIIRPQAIRSTGFALPSFSQPQQVSVAALHSKLSPGSPTSVIQRAVQGPQGTAQHPLDPSPPSTDSAPAAPDQQTGHVSSAVHDGEPAVVNAHGGIAVGKSQDAAYPEAQPHQTHAEPNWGSSEV